MKWKFSEFNSINHISGTYLNIRIALILSMSSITIGIVGFMLIEDYSFMDAFYMTVITISTVGYTEVQPLDANGKWFVSILILLNIGVIAYALAVFSNYVIEGKIFKNMHESLVKKQIAGLKNHIVVCGYGRYGQEVVDHFLERNIPFVVIEKSEEQIENIQKREELILHIQGDATDDEVLINAGLKNANALISTLGEDADNIFTVLTARQLNNKINIISRADQPRSEGKMKLAGANHVIMPEQIGGFYMATLVSKPGAIEFFSFIANEYESDISFEELVYEKLPTACCHKSIRELDIRKHSGANIIGYKKTDGTYMVNPSPDVRITPGTSFIVLGDRNQIKALHDYLDKTFN
ncbi:MAG: TrkA family potassium uptake protein [Saprospiraceae bacterium]